ncbi:MAG: hypothetical protein NTV34_02480, partial [Proteobacteria bacterium]|nr:hypothetical protein [Pseudomonadota bacterium]
SDRALFVDKHRAALTTALSSLTLKWNEDSSQISCAQVTSEYVVIKPSLCEGILTSEGAAELLIHEAFHVIGFENELDAIRNARMIMLGWQMRPTVSR